MEQLLPRDELDREYSPSSVAPQYFSILRDYRLRSDSARARHRHDADVRYGPEPAETLHFFPPPRGPAPVHVFVHGGHWQESSKEDSCFAAPAFLRAGAGFVALGYGLAPQRTLGDMVRSVRRGIRWIADHADQLGIRPDGVYLGGSSAGAHLVAAAVASDGGDIPPVAGITLLSGVYDLEPVRHSYVNDLVGMTPADVRAYSPLRHLPLRAARILVARAAAETGEYGRQQTDFVRAVRRAGQQCDARIFSHRNHFDLPLDLADPATPLGHAVLTQMHL
ncbi:alpha/beta hydrolase [Nocardia wallacei]|uniref:alpha/beta hydrolase n=1 Tax=Nocardia wallacei TaxID=480035 RepID=UPI002454EEF9|nr:alpha/beta hydrolase [Nocardia wallacei]